MSFKKKVAIAAASAVAFTSIIAPQVAAAPKLEFGESHGEQVCIFTANPGDQALMDEYLAATAPVFLATVSEIRDDYPELTDSFAHLDNYYSLHGAEGTDDFATLIAAGLQAKRIEDGLQTEGFTEQELGLLMAGPALGEDAFNAAINDAEMGLPGVYGQLTLDEARERLDTIGLGEPQQDATVLLHPFTENPEYSWSPSFKTELAIQEASVTPIAEEIIASVSTEAITGLLQECVTQLEKHEDDTADVTGSSQGGIIAAVLGLLAALGIGFSFLAPQLGMTIPF